MKLMFFVEEYTPDTYASFIRIHEMVNKFSSHKDADIKLVVYNPGSTFKYSEYELKPSNNVVIKRYIRKYAPRFFYLATFLNPFALISWCILVFKEIKAYDPDIIITTVPSLTPTIANYLISKIVHKPYCVDLRDNFISKKLGKYIISLNPWYSLLMLNIMFLIYNNLFIRACNKAALISTVYDKIIPDLQRVNNKSIILHIPNGINILELNNIKKDVDKDALFKKYNIPQDELTIIYVGRFGPWYKPEILIKPLKILIQEGYKLNYIIIGDEEKGEYKNAILKIITDNNLDNNVFLLGRLDHSDVISFLLSSDIGFYSLSIEFPNVDCLLSVKTLEYMACRLPILSSAPENSIASILIYKYNIGVQTDKSDFGTIYKLLKKIIIENKCYKDNYNNMIDYFIETFDRNSNNERLYQSISKLINSKN